MFSLVSWYNFNKDSILGSHGDPKHSLQRDLCSIYEDDIIVISHNNRTHLCVGGPHKRELPQYFNQSYFSLQQSKPHTNAVSRTMSKWHVTQLWTLGLLLRGEPTEVTSVSCPIDKYFTEPFRDELVRLLPILWVLLQVCNRNHASQLLLLGLSDH